MKTKSVDQFWLYMSTSIRPRKQDIPGEIDLLSRDCEIPLTTDFLFALCKNPDTSLSHYFLRSGVKL